MNKAAVPENIYTIATEAMAAEVAINKTATNGINCWYLIHTYLKQEDRAESNLKVLGVEVFSPKIIECRYNQYTNEPSYVTKSLFLRYIFAQFTATVADIRKSFRVRCLNF
jgi:hypothetical protein